MTVEEYIQKQIEKCREWKKHNDVSSLEDCIKWAKKVPEHIRLHIEKFGVEPVDIDMNWDLSYEERANLILESIKEGKPYNEYKMLSKEEQEDYDNGLLFF